MKERVTKKIRKDDTVLVLSGNSRGKTGKVIRVNGEKAVVQGVNVRKKHVRPTRTSKGGIVEMEMPLHVSNLKVSLDGKPVKLHVKETKDGKRELVYKSGSKDVVYRTLSRK